jgi:hypothetical protein
MGWRMDSVKGLRVMVEICWNMRGYPWWGWVGLGVNVI